MVTPYRKEMRLTESGFPFILIGKSFMHASQIGRIFGMVQPLPGGHDRLYDDSDKRCHKTDGIIFTPIIPPYPVGTARAVFKWKYPELLSIGS